MSLKGPIRGMHVMRIPRVSGVGGSALFAQVKKTARKTEGKKKVGERESQVILKNEKR